MKSLQIITFSIDRPVYLKRHLLALKHNMNGEYVHNIFCMGAPPTDEILDINNSMPNPANIEYWPEVLAYGPALNRGMEKATCDIIMKLDDDALISSSHFFNHVQEIFSLHDNAVFSPFPVGLINHLGGVMSDDRHVIYGYNTDTYYTLRKVPHVGGFARIALRNHYEGITFPSTIGEDAYFSRVCGERGIPMYYLENALIVEHCESTLGQRKRIQDAK